MTDDNQSALPEAPSDALGAAPPMDGSQIRGYRTLPPEVIARMNEVKSMEVAVAMLWKTMMADKSTDSRWLSIAKTHFEQGFMAMSRAVAKPVSPFEAKQP
jgi:hypothetical protein